MAQKIDAGTHIGIFDINNIRIKNGDLVRVGYINYMNTDKEYIDESFDAVIVYNPFNCMFMIDRVDTEIVSETWDECHIINHRSMRIIWKK